MHYFGFPTGRWMLPADSQSRDLKSAIARFHASAAAASADEALLLPDWREPDWEQLFRFTSIRNIPSGNALIQQGEADRTLYFVLRGTLEVIVRSNDGMLRPRAWAHACSLEIGAVATRPSPNNT